MALGLVRWTLDRAVRVQALARALCCDLGKTLYSHSASLHPGPGCSKAD